GRGLAYPAEGGVRGARGLARSGALLRVPGAGRHAALDVEVGAQAPTFPHIGAPAARDLREGIRRFVRAVLADPEGDAPGPARSDLGGDRARHTTLRVHAQGSAALRADG